MNNTPQTQKTARAMLRNERKTWQAIKDTFIDHIEKNDEYSAQDPIHTKAHWMQISFVMTAPDQEDLEDLRGLFAEQHPDWQMSIETKDNQYQLKGDLPQIKFTKITKAWYYQLLGFLQHYAVEFMCQLMPIRIVPV